MPSRSSPLSMPPSPRDSQRSRVYRAESAVTDTKLVSLDGCFDDMHSAVSSGWWARRFPWLSAERLPRLRPGNGARRAFFRPEPEPSITLPRRYRTRGVVLHELVHWGLDDSDGIADHGPTFTRVLLDATTALIGASRGRALQRSYQRHGVKVGARPLVDERGFVRYGWDERLERRRRQAVTVVTPDLQHTTAVFIGWGRGHLTVRLELEDGTRTSTPITGLLEILVPLPDGP